MIILITGATHSGKTAYAQRLMEKLHICVHAGVRRLSFQSASASGTNDDENVG